MASAAADPPPLGLSDELRRQLAPLRELLHGSIPNAVVPFVGSGLSRGLKSWTALLDELVNFLPLAERDQVRAALIQGKYLHVAGLLEASRSVGPPRIQAAIVRDFQEPKAPQPPIYAEVARLPTRHFLTTNYDPWLKDAVCRRLGKVPNLLLPSDGASLGHLDGERAWVFHLHGDADKPETCVLTARAYRRLLSGAPAWRDAVESLLRSRHLLFLGTSLSEPHLEVLLGEFEETFQATGGRRRHWWLGRPADAVERHRLEELGIEVVDYGDHALLSPILAWLAQPEPTTSHTPPHAPPAPTPIEPAAHATPDGGHAEKPATYDPSRPWFFVPFRPKGEHMIGRVEGLAQVRAALADGRPTVIGQTAAFTGIGGLGKTQLAVEYCHEARDEYPGGVYWFTADEDLGHQLLRLVEEAAWAHPSTEPAVAITMALKQLRSTRRALFVYDNVERERGPQDLRPAPGKSCHVLLTSRLEQPAFKRVELALLDAASSQQLVIDVAGRKPEGAAEDQALATICAHLDGLPLALELAGAWLNRFRSESFAEYMRRLASRGAGGVSAELRRFADRSATGHAPKLADALRISQHLLDEYPGLDHALDILAWSGTSSMSWSLLVALVAPADPEQLRLGLAVAEALRVVRREDRDGVPRFRMHRLVQEVRREERPVGDNPDMALAVLDRLGDWFEERRRDFSDLPDFEAELDHLDAWIGAADTLRTTAARVRLRWLRAYPSWHRGEYARALGELDIALDLFTTAAGDRGLEAHLHADRGVVLSLLGEHRRALEMATRALDLRRELLGERHSDTATSYDNVGGTWSALGEHQKALEMETRALDLRRELLGERHSDTATSYDNVGGTWSAMEEHRKALEMQTRALDLRRELLGERHPDTATSYANVGGTLIALGEHRRALEMQTRALDLRRELLGERHPDTATSYSNLGVALRALGEHRKALELQTHALDLCRELLGERHPDTASSYNNLGVIWSALGDHRKALELKTHALDLRRELLGERHPGTASAYNNVGATLRALGEHRKALEMETRALDLRRELLGERHPNTVSSAINVLFSFRALGRKADQFSLARDLVSRLPPSTPRYKEIVNAYNDTCPPGFRRLGPEGPKGGTGKEKAKKRR